MENEIGKLHQNMKMAIEIWKEKTNALRDAHATLVRYQTLKIPIPGELYRDIRDISIDILEFLDYADSFSTQSTHVRCMIQNYLELCEREGLYE